MLPTRSSPHYYSELYKNQLLENVIPFWEEHSIDTDYGGYYTCLNQYGEVYDTDKFVWLQARQIWTFTMLYNQIAKKEAWLKIAKGGIDFLKKYGRDKNGSFYFSLTREGKPLTHAFNIYSDCFAAAAFGCYALASGDEESLQIARETYHLFINRQSNPKGSYEKTTGARPLKSFGLPMMTAWLTLELDFIVSEDKQVDILENCLHEILEVHYSKEQNLIFENVSLNHEFIDTYEGRLINPGHAIEAMWFVMDVADHLNRTNLLDTATDLCLRMLEYGWDDEHGGIFYFMDAKSAPLQQLEWDQKLWWVHQEALIALSKAYFHTRRQDVWNWYVKVHNYAWNRFPDAENGEWFGYLNRQGQPHTKLKGGKWKGCFHTPRTMYECWQNFKKIENSH